MPLTLRGAVLLALDRSPELEVERMEAAARGTLPDEARAEFDPQLAASLSHGESERQTTARQEALETSAERVRRGRVDEGSLEVTKSFATGTDITVAADADRNRSNVSPEQFGARAEFRVDQALLQGLRPSANLARVRIAENEAQIGRYVFLGALQDLLAGVESAYWDLVFSRWALEVRVRSLDAARRLLGDAEARVAAGKLPRVELAAARAEVAAREESLEDARAALETARLELLRWLDPDDRSLPWSADLEPVDAPTPLRESLDAESAVAIAMERRPDLLQARLELTNGELQVVETRDGLLPKLDLFASYAHTGLGTNLSEAWNTVFTEGFEDWRVGVTFETALWRRAERARARRAGFDRDRARAALENLELVVEAQVRKAAVEVQRLRRKVELAQATAAARREEALAEKARFDAGRATSSDVLQAENRLREAQLGWQRARTDARKAWAEFVRLEGRLIEEWGIEVF